MRIPVSVKVGAHYSAFANFATRVVEAGGLDAARGLLAGADVVMMTSALLRHDPEHVAAVEAELVAWAAQFDVDAIDELRGSASQRHVADPEAFERANYLEGLVDYANSFHSAQGAGRW